MRVAETNLVQSLSFFLLLFAPFSSIHALSSPSLSSIISVSITPGLQCANAAPALHRTTSKSPLKCPIASRKNTSAPPTATNPLKFSPPNGVHFFSATERKRHTANHAAKTHQRCISYSQQHTFFRRCCTAGSGSKNRPLQQRRQG